MVEGGCAKMETIKLKSTTQYFAIKKVIVRSIEIFMRKKTPSQIIFVSSFNDDESLEVFVDRQTIIDFLGYDFRARKMRFKKDCKAGGKLSTKTQILVLYGKILNDMYE